LAIGSQELLHHIEIYVSDLERSMEFWTPLMGLLGYEAERWSEGMNYIAGEDDPYLCIVQASAEHIAAGYHRKRVGLNHLAFRAKSRAQVDDIRDWLKNFGATLLYDDRYPYATSPTYYAVYFEDPDRIKLEVVAPGEC
jgi:catechol 2,3-dioxygenase-like lactoylglutathione lyase family enzyme